MTVKNTYISNNKDERKRLQKNLHKRCILILQSAKDGE